MPKVPLPEAGHFDEKALQFPIGRQSQTVISSYHEEEHQQEQVSPAVSAPPQTSVKRSMKGQSPVAKISMHRHHYVKVEMYQQLLADLDGLKKDLTHLGETNHLLETSEFNEEADYDKIKRNLKNVHDKIVSIDKTLFVARN